MVLCLLAPLAARASVSSVVFTTDPQTVAPNTASDVLTLGVQDETGNSVSGGVPQTVCIALTSTSATGQFSSSATSWNPIMALTMNKSTSKRNFFYKDSSAGSYTLSALFALKPASVSTSCASWPQAEWGTIFTTTQHITVGNGSNTNQTNTQNSQEPSDPPDDFSEGSSTNANTQETVSVPTGAGSETLTASIKTQPVVVVGGGSFFTGSARDSAGAKVGDVRYLWNFGDGTTAEGQSAFHVYRYPGSYAVGLTVAAGSEAGIARTTLQASPADISVLAENDGSVVLVNHSPQEVNIGLWNIASALNTFVIPLETILLGGKSLRFSPATLQFWVDDATTLRYPNNVIAAAPISESVERAFAASSDEAKAPSATSASASSTSGELLIEGASAAEGAPQRDGARIEQFPSKEIVYPEAATSAVDLASVALSGISSLTWLVPYVLGALGLILICMAIVFGKAPKARETPKVPHEFDIEA